MRVVFVCAAGLGHVYPLLPLARAAVAAGDDAMDCDIAVVHAGSGTTVAALARGLPMVAVPMFADQMHNADRLVDAHLGRRVDPDQISSQLTGAVEAVLADPGYRANARCVAEAIAGRPSPAKALNVLRQHVSTPA